MSQRVDFYPCARQLLAALAFSIGLLTEVMISSQLPTCAANSAGGPGATTLNRPPAPVTVSDNRSAKPLAPAAPSAKTREDEIVVLQSSKALTAAAPQWQKWDDYITIKPGQEHMPLTLTFENGSGGSTPFEDLRIRLAGKPLASIRDFKGLPTLNLNLTDAIGVGDSLITIQGYGKPGARLAWKLTTPKVYVTGVKPDSFGLTDKVVVQGRNFVERPSVDRVTIGNKPVTVVSAKKTELTLKLPSDLPGGKQDLIVTVGTIRSNPFKVTVKSPPEVTAVNFISTCPGQPIVVYGKGFSTTASENEVMIGGVQAPISSASATSISCTVPDLPFPQWYVPITVKTNGMDSKGTVTINLQQRVIENDGVPEQ
jgi:hypothetical protein